MTYVRFSLMRPTRGNEERVVSLIERLNESARQHEGCLEAYTLYSNDGAIARLAIYTDEDAAEQTAQDASIMAIRSEMHRLIEPGHDEHGLSTERP
jgi:quinol monooxygenase YgiN